MALILTKAAPTYQLQKALIDFENILTDDEKKDFRAQETPDAQAAFKLTVLIDENTNNPRCYGQRFSEFLESVQEFSKALAAPGDTLVSARPDVAALVWGGVKLSLLVVNNVSSYFDKISTLFMRIARTCPRFKKYGLLYPSSTDLQTALCNYYAAVVRLCRYAKVSSRQPKSTRLLSAAVYPYEAQFGRYEKELKDLFEEFEKAVDLASKETQSQQGHALELIKERIFRVDDYSKRLQIEATNRATEEKRVKTLDTFSTYPFRKWYGQIRKECIPGTSRWVCEDATFQAWLVGPLKVLWCTGRLGSGKSVISASVVAHIIETKSSEDTASFFFCRFDDQESLKARTIVGSIAKQLASRLAADAFTDFEDTDLDASAISTFLLAHLCPTQRHFIVLDGIDDCDALEAKEVTGFLCRMVDSPLQVKIYCASRPMSRLPLNFRPEQLIDLDTKENKDKLALDINRYIHVMLAERLEGDAPALLVHSSHLILEIRDRLQAEAEGMFLWVKFQIQTLCEKRSDSQIRTALENLPRDLPETFERILQQCTDAEDIKLGRQIFRWLAVAKRPLTVHELQDAIATQPLQKTWDAERLVNDMVKAMVCCSNLIFVDEEHETVHFTHASVKQYLTSQAVGQSLPRYHIDLEEANAEAGAICVTYAHFPKVGTQVARRVEFSRHLNSIPQTVVKTSLPHGITSIALASKLFHSEKRSRESLARLLRNVSGDTEDHRQQSALKHQYFRPYAEYFWLEHTNRRIDPESSSEMWTLWRSLTERAQWSKHLSGIPWTFDGWFERRPSLMRWIVVQNHCSLAQLVVLLETEPVVTTAVPLLILGAASQGHSDLLKICLGLKEVPQEVLDYALLLGAGSAKLTIVKQLLAVQADPNRRLEISRLETLLDSCYLSGFVQISDLDGLLDLISATFDGSALQAAAHNGHSDIVEALLLHESIDVNAPAVGYGGRTALQAAVAGGHLRIAERLIHAKANVNADAGDLGGRTALQAAVEHNHQDLIEILLHHGAHINAPSGFKDGRTAFQVAAECGHTDLIKRLLDGSFGEVANINAPAGPYCGTTALQAAITNGHFDLAKILVDEGADFDADGSDSHRRKALQLAAATGDLELVESILRKGANVNADPFETGHVTALQVAAESGSLAMVKTLLQAKAEVNVTTHASGAENRTALHAAAEAGHLEIVSELVDHGADAHRQPTFTHCVSVIQAARQGGHPEIVNFLIERGAVDSEAFPAAMINAAIDI